LRVRPQFFISGPLQAKSLLRPLFVSFFRH
jgi:hypothetical protein